MKKILLIWLIYIRYNVTTQPDSAQALSRGSSTRDGEVSCQPYSLCLDSFYVNISLVLHRSKIKTNSSINYWRLWLWKKLENDGDDRDGVPPICVLLCVLFLQYTVTVVCTCCTPRCRQCCCPDRCRAWSAPQSWRWPWPWSPWFVWGRGRSGMGPHLSSYISTYQGLSSLV